MIGLQQQINQRMKSHSITSITQKPDSQTNTDCKLNMDENKQFANQSMTMDKIDQIENKSITPMDKINQYKLMTSQKEHVTSQERSMTSSFCHMTDSSSSGYDDDDEEGDLIVDEDVTDESNDVMEQRRDDVRENTHIEPDSTNHVEEPRRTNQASWSHQLFAQPTSNPIRSLEQVVNRLTERSSSCSPTNGGTQGDQKTEAAGRTNNAYHKQNVELSMVSSNQECTKPNSSSLKPSTSPPLENTQNHKATPNKEKSEALFAATTFPPGPPIPGMFPMPGGFPPFGMPPTAPFGLYPGMMAPGMNLLPGMGHLGMIPTPPGMMTQSDPTTPNTSSTTTPLDLSGSALKRKSPVSQSQRDGEEGQDTGFKKRKLDQATPVKPVPVAQPHWLKDALSRQQAANQTETTPSPPVNQSDVTSTNTNQQKDSSISPAIKSENSKSAISPCVDVNQDKPGSAFTPLRQSFQRQPMTPISPFAAPTHMYPPSPFMPGGMMGYGAHHPMFNPFMMSMFPGSPMAPHHHPMMLQNNIQREEALSGELKALESEFNELVDKLGPDSSVFQAQQNFKMACASLSAERQRALLTSPTGNNDVMMTSYFDNQLYALVRMTQAQLEGEKRALEFGGKLKVEPGSDRLLTVHSFGGKTQQRSVTPPEDFSKPLHASSPYGSQPNSKMAKSSPVGASLQRAELERNGLDSAETQRSTPRNLQSSFQSMISPRPHNGGSSMQQPSPVQPQQPNPRHTPHHPFHTNKHQLPKFPQLSPHDTTTQDTSTESGFLDSSDVSPTGCYGDSVHSNRRRLLSNAAVEVLQAWYERHREHPYPDDEQVEEIGRMAGISECQVRKWMANKRVRNCNTLAYNGSIHPKKLQKLIQMRENNVTLSDVTPRSNDVSTLSDVTNTSSQMEQPHNMMTSSSNTSSLMAGSTGNDILDQMRARGVDIKPRKAKAKRLLNPKAVEAMNQWYFEHINYPYPSDDEKQQLADDNGISVPQVTCWFANKRNRSNNTRKLGHGGSKNRMRFSGLQTTQTQEQQQIQNGGHLPLSLPMTSPPGFMPFPVLNGTF